MSDTDAAEIRSSISHSHFGDNSRLHLGPFSNNVTLNLSPGGNSGTKIANEEFLQRLGPINPLRDRAVLDGVHSGLPTNGFDWVFELEVYTNWEAGRGPSVFWVQDQTGSGHTVLTLRLLDRLLLLRQDNQALVVAYCFCQPNGSTSRTSTQVLQSLLFSIFRQDTGIMNWIRERYGDLFQASSGIDTSEHFLFLTALKETLKKLVQSGSTLYLVIDGLDQLSSNSPSHDVEQVIKLLVPEFPTFLWIISSRLSPRLLPATYVETRQLSSLSVAQALGLGASIATITYWGQKLENIYDHFNYSHQFSDVTWFEHTRQGRLWLNVTKGRIWCQQEKNNCSCELEETEIEVRGSRLGTNQPPCGSWEAPCDLSLQLVDTIRTSQGFKCAYFSFACVLIPSATPCQSRNSLLEPLPALWCLFVHLANETYRSEEELAAFLTSLPRELQNDLIDICKAAHDRGFQWFQRNGHLRNMAAGTANIPYLEWNSFLDCWDPQMLVSLIKKTTGGRLDTSFTLIIDSMHLAKVDEWIKCLEHLRDLFVENNNLRLFVSGAPNPVADAHLSLEFKHFGPVTSDTEYHECLKTLYFQELHYRRTQVPEGLPDTNRWLKSNPAYLEWSGSGGLLWISGKAGSGKSVLAKTICNDHLSRELREEWIVCDWFYSRRDHHIGMGHTSMLKAILYEMITQWEGAFEAVKVHYRGAWERIYENGGNGAWPFEALKDLIRTLSSSPTTRKILAIVDGLDESEGSQRRETLELLVEITSAATSKIRIIALSRPEPSIEDVFLERLRISMQECNANDICHIIDVGMHAMRHFWLRATNAGYYNRHREGQTDSAEIIHSNVSNWLLFTPSAQIPLRESEEGELTRIRQYLVDHAAGVTLWVRLIIQHLLIQITDDTIPTFNLQQLRGTLGQLPTELEDLYGAILTTLGLYEDPEKRMVAHRIFAWVIGSRSYQPLQLQDLLDAIAIPDTDSEADLGDVGENDPIWWKKYQIGDNWNSFRRLIYQHCGPLIELIEPPKDLLFKQYRPFGTDEAENRVRNAQPTCTLQLIHQTAVSFLESPVSVEDPVAGNQVQVPGDYAKLMIRDRSYRYLRMVLPDHTTPYIRSRDDEPAIPAATAPICEPVGAYWIFQLDYLSQRPFIKYALKVLLDDPSDSPGNWISKSTFNWAVSGQFKPLNTVFPLWWVIHRYFRPYTRHADYLRHFTHYACSVGDTVALEIIFSFTRLFEKHCRWAPKNRVQRLWSMLRGAIDLVLRTAELLPHCWYPIVDYLRITYQMIASGLAGDEAFDALSDISKRKPERHPRTCHTVLQTPSSSYHTDNNKQVIAHRKRSVPDNWLESQNPSKRPKAYPNNPGTHLGLYHAHCKNQVVPVGTSGVPGGISYVPIWKMHDAVEVVVLFAKEQLEKPGVHQEGRTWLFEGTVPAESTH